MNVLTLPRRSTAMDHAIRVPKTLSASATVGDVQDFFDDDHVHLALITHDGYLDGCVTRDDLVGAHPGARALSVATRDGRVIACSQSITVAREMLERTDARRLAVVDTEGRLVGLLCLKRSGTGFCSDADVAAREAEREAHRIASAVEFDEQAVRARERNTRSSAGRRRATGPC